MGKAKVQPATFKERIYMQVLDVAQRYLTGEISHKVFAVEMVPVLSQVSRKHLEEAVEGSKEEMEDVVERPDEP